MAKSKRIIRVKFKVLPSVSRLRELFAYDKSTGILTWRKSTNSRVRPGDEFGCLNGANYRIGNVDGTTHMAHRIIWAMVTGTPSSTEIDHVNAVPDDNRWVNLREATSSQNCWNVSVQRRSKTGFKGVTPRGKKFFVKIGQGGKQYYLGMFDTPEAGSAAYMARAKELFGEFARAA